MISPCFDLLFATERPAAFQVCGEVYCFAEVRISGLVAHSRFLRASRRAVSLCTRNTAKETVLAANVGRAVEDRLAAHKSHGTTQLTIVFNGRPKRYSANNPCGTILRCSQGLGRIPDSFGGYHVAAYTF